MLTFCQVHEGSAEWSQDSDAWCQLHSRQSVPYEDRARCLSHWLILFIECWFWPHKIDTILTLCFLCHHNHVSNKFPILLESEGQQAPLQEDRPYCETWWLIWVSILDAVKQLLKGALMERCFINFNSMDCVDYLQSQFMGQGSFGHQAYPWTSSQWSVGHLASDSFSNQQSSANVVSNFYIMWKWRGRLGQARRMFLDLSLKPAADATSEEKLMQCFVHRNISTFHCPNPLSHYVPDAQLQVQVLLEPPPNAWRPMWAMES